MAIRNLIATIVACAAASTVAPAQPIQNQHETQAAAPVERAAAAERVGPHGGQLREVGSLRTELLVDHGSLRLFFYDRQGQPIDVRHGRGLVTLQVAGEAKKYRYDLFAEIGRDKTAPSLAVAADFTRIGGRQVDFTFKLVRVPGAGRRPLQFSSTTRMPLTAAQQIAAAIAAQGICPVSRQPLGSMGKPIAVSVGDKMVYVCCAGCVDAVKSNPQKFLGKVPPHSKAKKPKLVKVTEADAQFVAAQKLCPVMDEALDAMGGPFRTVVLGRVIYVCCPGCAKKLHDDPVAYLNKLDSQGVVPPRAR